MTVTFDLRLDLEDGSPEPASSSSRHGCGSRRRTRPISAPRCRTAGPGSTPSWTCTSTCTAPRRRDRTGPTPRELHPGIGRGGRLPEAVLVRTRTPDPAHGPDGGSVRATAAPGRPRLAVPCVRHLGRGGLTLRPGSLLSRSELGGSAHRFRAARNLPTAPSAPPGERPREPDLADLVGPLYGIRARMEHPETGADAGAFRPRLGRRGTAGRGESGAGGPDEQPPGRSAPAAGRAPVTPSAPVVTSRPDRDGRDSHGPDAGPHLVERLENSALAPSALPPCRTIAVWPSPTRTSSQTPSTPCSSELADRVVLAALTLPGAARPARPGGDGGQNGLAAVS